MKKFIQRFLNEEFFLRGKKIFILFLILPFFRGCLMGEETFGLGFPFKIGEITVSNSGFSSAFGFEALPFIALNVVACFLFLKLIYTNKTLIKNARLILQGFWFSSIIFILTFLLHSIFFIASISSSSSLVYISVFSLLICAPFEFFLHGALDNEPLIKSILNDVLGRFWFVLLSIFVIQFLLFLKRRRDKGDVPRRDTLGCYNIL